MERGRRDAALVSRLRAAVRAPGVAHRLMLADHGFTFEWCAGRVNPPFLFLSPKRPLFPPICPSISFANDAPATCPTICRRWRGVASRARPSCRHRWGRAVGASSFRRPTLLWWRGRPFWPRPPPSPPRPLHRQAQGQKAGHRAGAPRKLATPPFRAQPASPPSINAHSRASQTTPAPVTPSSTIAAADPAARGRGAPGIKSG